MTHARGESRVAVSRLYLDSSFDDASVGNLFFFECPSVCLFHLRVHSQQPCGCSFRFGAARIPRRIAIREFSTRTVRLAAKARRSARDRASRDVEADGATSARRLVSMRPARSRREPTGRLDAATRAGPSRVLGRFGSITRTDARRCRRRGGTDARVEFRAGGAEHTHRAEHVPPGRGHEAET